PDDIERLANLCGPFDERLRQIEMRMGVEIANRGNVFRVNGPDPMATRAERFLKRVYARLDDVPLTPPELHILLADALNDTDAKPTGAAAEFEPQEVVIRVKRGSVRGRGANQSKYLHAIATHDLNFGIGPAGTGKTFLGVASAVEALNEG